MRVVLWILLAGLIVVAGGWYLAGLPGEVSVGIGRYTVELSTALAVALGLLALFLILLLFRLLLGVRGAGAALRRMRARRRRDAGDAAVTASLVAIAAARPDVAQRQAARARKLLGDQPQPLLMAAEAARLAGDQDTAATLYRELAARPDAALLGLRGLFRQAMAREDFEEAAALASRAETAYPGGAWLRDERRLLAARTGDWHQAIALSAPADPARADYATAAVQRETDPVAGERMARKLFADYPDFPPAALAYAARLRAAGQDDRARGVLTRAWGEAPVPDLAAAAMDTLDDPQERLQAAALMAAQRPEHLESRLLLARLNLQAGRPDAARAQLDAAPPEAQDDRRYWLLRADLEGAERGGSEAGRAALREALRRAAEASSDPHWRCGACGAATAHWHAACPTCHTPGQVRWGNAPKLALLPAPAEPW
jgi:HemY protein